jgi:hypothetical protein
MPHINAAAVAGGGKQALRLRCPPSAAGAASGRPALDRCHLFEKRPGPPPALRMSNMPVLTLPSDFTDHAPRQTNRQLAERYGVGEKTVTRWRKETGCTAAIRPFASAALPKQHVPSITSGLAGEAAQHLRKTHRPVYHRIIEGREYRGQYVVGTQVLSEQELVALAFEKGFRLY